MKRSTKDQAKGKLHELKGKAKAAAGKLTGDPDLEAEGEAEETMGKVQAKVGEIGKVVGQ